MKMEGLVKTRIIKNVQLSVLLYLLPVALMLAAFAVTGQRPWIMYHAPSFHAVQHHWYNYLRLNDYGLVVFMLGLGIVEFFLGFYDEEWTPNERKLDIACFLLPRVIVGPIVAFFSLTALPYAIPALRGVFGWVPFFWGIPIICVMDDLTQYWYHRLHHEIPFLWRFHRTHHSAPYMGMAMASRQNIIYTIFFSQTWLTAVLTYLGLGPAAIAVRGVKSVITLTAHSSIPWDRPLYKHRFLHPIAWIVERTISTPATHHAHHADTTEDGIGYYKGNFGNMFFLWDVIFGTAHISRQYPARYGISHYESDEWYAQIFWPIVKSSIPGSELAPDGPVVRQDAPTKLGLENTGLPSGQAWEPLLTE